MRGRRRRVTERCRGVQRLGTVQECAVCCTDRCSARRRDVQRRDCNGPRCTDSVAPTLPATTDRAMHPAKVNRHNLHALTDLPNIGKAGAGDLVLLGIHTPQQLVGRDAFALYNELCERTGVRHDPCVIDVFLSVTRFMAGDDARPWWDYTDERKRLVRERMAGDASTTA
jgi:Pathogenicity locus